jgi:hypothetical protein
MMTPVVCALIYTAAFLGGLLIVYRVGFGRGYEVGERHGVKTTQAALHGEIKRARLRLLELSGMTEDQAWASYFAWVNDHDDLLARRARKVLGVRA